MKLTEKTSSLDWKKFRVEDDSFDFFSNSCISKLITLAGCKTLARWQSDFAPDANE